MRIGIFGGSFDPVHRGHVGIAENAIADLALDRLVVVPAAVSPFKTETLPGLSADRRLMLVRAAFSGMEKVAVDDRELRRGGVSYAVDTVGAIAAENPGAEIFFVIGEDSVEGLPRWKDWERLKTLCTFRAYPRTAESSTEIRALLANRAGRQADAAAETRLRELLPESVYLFLAYGVEENDDVRTAETVRRGLVRRKGYCPCRLAATPENFCPCAEFRGQLADPSFAGLCHCRLYRKPRKDRM